MVVVVTGGEDGMGLLLSEWLQDDRFELQG
jgi:hypothetical protein